MELYYQVSFGGAFPTLAIAVWTFLYRMAWVPDGGHIAWVFLFLLAATTAPVSLITGVFFVRERPWVLAWLLPVAGYWAWRIGLFGVG